MDRTKEERDIEKYNLMVDYNTALWSSDSGRKWLQESEEGMAADKYMFGFEPGKDGKLPPLPDTETEEFIKHFQELQKALQREAISSRVIQEGNTNIVVSLINQEVPVAADAPLDDPIFISSTAYRAAKKKQKQERGLTEDPEQAPILYPKEAGKKRVTFDSVKQVSLMPHTENDYFFQDSQGNFFTRNAITRSMPSGFLGKSIESLSKELTLAKAYKFQRYEELAKSISEQETKVMESQNILNIFQNTLLSQTKLSTKLSKRYGLQGFLMNIGSLLGLSKSVARAKTDVDAKIQTIYSQISLHTIEVQNAQSSLAPLKAELSKMGPPPRDLDLIKRDLRKAQAELAGYSEESGMGVRVAEVSRARDVQRGLVPILEPMSVHTSLTTGAEQSLGDRPLKSCPKKPKQG